MARGSLFLGQARGKLGTTVQYVAKGEQRSRVYTREGGRPGSQASLPARLQRVRFGAASNEWGIYKFICKQMFRKGKLTKESDYNFFVRKNWINFPWLTKQENFDGISVWIPGVYTTGNLGTSNQSIVTTISNGKKQYRVYDSAASVYNGESVQFRTKLIKLKEAYRQIYNNADKVTLLILFNGINGENIEDESNFKIASKTLCLNKENTPGENDITIKEWLNSISNNVAWNKLVDNTTEDTAFVTTNGTVARFAIEEENETVTSDDYKDVIMVLIPTNDNANETYTVNVLAVGAASEYSPWNSYLYYRSEEQLRAAAASYGYSASTLQSDIYFTGDEITADVQRTIKLLQVFDPDYAAEMEENQNQIIEEAKSRIAKKRAEAQEELTVSAAEVEQADALLDQALSQAKADKNRKNQK